MVVWQAKRHYCPQSRDQHDWDQHNLVAILKRIRIAAERADVLVVDVDVDERAQLAVLVLDLGGECWESPLEFVQQGEELEVSKSNCCGHRSGASNQ